MEPQNQYYYGRTQGPPMQQDPSFPVSDMDHSKMGPMMRALTEDFDISGQNSTNYNQQGITNIPGTGDQQRIGNNFGPASQTLSGYASQYSSGPGSQNYFGHGHATSPLNSGFSPPGANYSPGGMGSPYHRQVASATALGNSNGHGHNYSRSASAGPTIPSPIMMHGPGMYPHNQSSPGNRPTNQFGFPTSPTSPHNHVNHASPPLASPSSMRPGGTLHSPKSLPASSPVPFASQMSPTASRAQSVPTLPGNSIDHLPSMPHARSKSPGSAGIHRPYPQPPGQQQQLYPLPSPKVRPVDQTDSRGHYVELVHSKPSGDQWNPKERQSVERTRRTSAHEKVSDPGHLPRLEEMVAVLGESKAKESLDQIVSDSNSSIQENQTNGSPPGDVERTPPAINACQVSCEKRTQIECEKGDKSTNSTESVGGKLANGVAGKCEMDVKPVKMNGPSDEVCVKESQVKRVTKTYCGKAGANPNGRKVVQKQTNVNPTNGTNNETSLPFKSPWAKQAKTSNTDETKEAQNIKQAHNTTACHSFESENKCQTDSTSTKHSLANEQDKTEPSPSTVNETDVKVGSPPMRFDNPMTTPSSKRKNPEDGESSTGDDSLPLKKRRGRPPGTKNKTKKDGEEGKSKKRYAKKKKPEFENETEDELSKVKPNKSVVKQKAEINSPVIRGPILRVQGSSITTVISSQVVNTPGTEEEQIKGGKKKNVFKQVKRESVSVAGHFGQAAVLATEPQSPTGLWVCTLCGNPANFGILGDLYGPYHPPGHGIPCSKRDGLSRHDRHHARDSRGSRPSPRGNRLNTKSPGRAEAKEGRNKRGKSLMAKQADPKKIRKWRQINTYIEEMSLSVARKRLSTKKKAGEEEDSVVQLWVHEECAVWAQGVFFFQGMLYGIHEAAKAAESKKCSLCRDSGASIGCLSKGCKQVYHYLCAIESECQMHLENYSMTCPKHKNKKVKLRGGT